MTFTKDTTTDSKRFVRGEHWLAARTYLRRRDRVHAAEWKVLTLAGGNPEEEIGCIRSLMPRATIVAADTDPACCSAALAAGADEAICIDVCAWRREGEYSVNYHGDPWKRSALAAPVEVAEFGLFDVVNLDFCGTITEEMETAVRIYSSLVRRGLLMTTFSYGRDVVEIYQPGDYRGVPHPLSGRVRRLDEFARYGQRLVSVIAYKGPAMPMCSLQWEWRPLSRRPGGAPPPVDPSFVSVVDDDLFVACAFPDAAPLYGLPRERVLAFRRKAAALKAVATKARTTRP